MQQNPAYETRDRALRASPEGCVFLWERASARPRREGRSCAFGTEVGDSCWRSLGWDDAWPPALCLVRKTRLFGQFVVGLASIADRWDESGRETVDDLEFPQFR